MGYQIYAHAFPIPKILFWPEEKPMRFISFSSQINVDFAKKDDDHDSLSNSLDILSAKKPSD